MEYNKSPVQLNSGVVGGVGKVGNTASSYSETIVMPEPQGLIRIDWWGHTFVPEDRKGDGSEGLCEININGAIWKGPAKFSVQGSSSAKHPKKNMKMDLKNKDGKRIPMKIGSSVPTEKWVWKCDYTDASKSANLIGFKLFEAIVNSRKSFPKNDVDTYWLNQTGMDTPLGMPTGAVGYPIIHPAVMYHNDEFYGIGMILIKQDPVNKNIFEDNPNHISFEFDGRDGIHHSKSWQNLYPESPNVGDFFPEEWTPERTAAIQGLSDVINGTQENFNENWQNHFVSKQSLIDYYLYLEFLYDYDGVAQDLDFVCYDGQRFYIVPWDKDTVLGIPWNAGGEIMSPTSILVSKTYIPSQFRIWAKTRNAFESEIEERYAELRNLGIFSTEWILNTANKYLGRFSTELFEMEYERWPDTFNRSNSVVRVADWVDQRLVTLDREFNYTP